MKAYLLIVRFETSKLVKNEACNNGKWRDQRISKPNMYVVSYIAM